jgi:nitrite reductase/ring-hydroxylating ferredoxin subunit
VNPLIPPAGEDTLASNGFVGVEDAANLSPGSRRSLLLGHRRILLYNSGEDVHAFAEVCPHALQPLTDGEIYDRTVRCSKHGAHFDLNTGKPLNGVTSSALKIYRVRIRNGRIEVAEPVDR